MVSKTAISGAISKEQADFVILPVNLASKLYNEGAGYKLQAVITHGNFYLVSSFAVNSVQDLVGKVVHMPNNFGTVPDLTFKSILIDNNIEYAESATAISGKVAIQYFKDGASVIGSLSVNGSDSVVAMLPEPAATQIKNKKPIYSNRFDLQSAYDGTAKSFPQAVLMVKNTVTDTALIQKMQEEFNLGVEWIKENPQKAVDAVKSVFEATSLVSLNRSMIEGCNIYWGNSQDEKQAVQTYLQKIKGIIDTSANLVNDDFFR